MRAIVLGSVPVTLAAMFFRGPSSSLAVLVKTAFPLDGSQPGAGFVAPALREDVDVVPRKSDVDVVVLGEAVSAEPTRELPVELQFGRSIRKHVVTRVTKEPWLRAAVTPFEPLPLELAATAPCSAAEAALAPAWFDVSLEGDQIAPMDQRSTEELDVGATLSTSNLAKPGRAQVRVPSFVPFCLVVNGDEVAGSPRVALRGDTLLVDAERGLVEISHRGEVSIDRITPNSVIVCGLLPRGARPDVAAIEELLRTTTPIDVPTFPLEPSDAPEETHQLARSPAFDLVVKVRGWTLGARLAKDDDQTVHEATNDRGTAGWLTILGDESSRDPSKVLRAKRLLDARRRLDPLRVSAVLDRGETERGNPFWVDARAAGTSLASSTSPGRAWDVASALSVFRGLALALAAIHRRGLIVVALGPSDVFVEGEHVTLRPSLAWIEVGDRASDAEIDPRYASPELARGDGGEVTPASDVWSAAAIVVELLAGKPLSAFWRGKGWPVPSVITFLTGLPPNVADVFDACFDIQPTARPDSGTALVDRLDRAALPVARSESTAVFDLPPDPIPASASMDGAWALADITFDAPDAADALGLVAVPSLVGLPFDEAPLPSFDLETMPPPSDADGDLAPTIHPPRPHLTGRETLPPLGLPPQETMPALPIPHGALPFIERAQGAAKTVPPPAGPWSAAVRNDEPMDDPLDEVTGDASPDASRVSPPGRSM